MAYTDMDLACGEPDAGTASTGRRGDPASRRRGTTVVLSALAAGGLSLLAACGTTASSTPAAAKDTPTPTVAATQTSSPTPAASPSADSPTTAPPAGTVTAGPASSSQLAQFTAAAQGQCGFTSSADTLTNAKVTNNGWGSATVTAQNPQAQGGGSMVFRLGASWTYDTCGSSFDNGSIPQDVLTALGL